MYPILRDNVCIGTFTYEDSPEEHYFASNAKGDEFEISEAAYNLLMKADGTQPLNASKRLIRRLEDAGIITTKRLYKQHGLSYFRLFVLGDEASRIKPICRPINRLLPFVSVLCFAIGVIKVRSAMPISGVPCYWLVFLSIVWLSTACHETGHVVSAVSYGFPVHEVGVLLLGILPNGMYVSYDEPNDATKMERWQVAMSGIQCNILIAGLLLLLSQTDTKLSYTFMMAANTNVLLAIHNSLPSFSTIGMDGEKALSIMLGIDSIGKVAKHYMLSKKRRRKLLKSGLAGILCYIGCAVIRLADYMLFIFIAYCILKSTILYLMRI